MRRLALAGLLVVLICTTAFAVDHVAGVGKKIPATVVRVVDGDTLVCLVDGKNEKVRLIGIDCPESKDNRKHKEDAKRDCCHTSDQLIDLGKEATAFTTSVAAAGKAVQLEIDVQERDKYHRVLAYIWADGRLLNAELLREGLAQLMTIPPNVKRANYFYQVQKKAQRENKGVWKR